MVKHINLPLTEEDIENLRAGDNVLLSGVMFTSRDAGHKRICAAINNGQQPPVEIKGATVYYVGPCPNKPGKIIGSCGPTTSYRCDPFTPLLLENGLKGMIGKGIRSQKVIDSIVKHHAVYFCGIGGAGALYSQCVTDAKLIAYEDLGAEALRILTVQDLPVIVAVDCKGNSVFA
ncbi:MAG: Fe-S-containing hydro-lyase [Clostridia bacterium]